MPVAGNKFILNGVTFEFAASESVSGTIVKMLVPTTHDLWEQAIESAVNKLNVQKFFPFRAVIGAGGFTGAAAHGVRLYSTEVDRRLAAVTSNSVGGTMFEGRAGIPNSEGIRGNVKATYGLFYLLEQRSIVDWISYTLETQQLNASLLEMFEAFQDELVDS